MENFFDFAFEPKISGIYELYFRSEGFVFEKGILTAEREEAEVSFDTYFNITPSAKLRKYTNAEEIIFTVCGKDIEAEIFASDGLENISLGNAVRIPLKNVPENAVYIYPVIRAQKKGAILKSISVQLEGRTIPTSIALIICTYKREEYLFPNLKYISEKIKNKALDMQIITVDNAKSISAKDMPECVILVPNDNTGGSGGFTKGMETAAKMNCFTHFILMDDDVKLDIVSLQKLIGFLRFRNEKHKDISISGSMLYLDKPNIQFESGGRFEIDGTQQGFGHFLDMTDRKNLSDNEQTKNANYGGWWFMCIPMKYVNEGNYPLPFFIKYDDVEYALRCKLEIITLNGVSVWHEPFEWKYNSSSEYYNIRNLLFLCSITDKKFTKRQARKIAYKQVFEKLCRQQYKMAEAVKLGYEDFLKGINFLYELNSEENHKKICRLNYEMLSEEELFNRYGVRFSEEKYLLSQNAVYKWYMRPLLYGLILPNIFCKKDYAVVDLYFDRKEMYFGYKKAVHWNHNSKTGYITQRNK